MRAVEIDPAQIRGPANHCGSGERAQTGDDANRKGKAENDGGVHGEKLSRKGSRNEPRGGNSEDNRAEKKRGPSLGSRAPKIALRWLGLGVTKSRGHPSSFPLRGRWERPIPSRK